MRPLSNGERRALCPPLRPSRRDKPGGSPIHDGHFGQSLARAAVLLVLCVFSSGCPKVYRSETVWHADGSVDRAIYQDRDATPESVRRSKVWLQTTSAPDPQTLERRGWSSPISKFPVKKPGEAGPYFAAWGHFQSPQELPAHFIRRAPDGAAVPDSELVRRCNWTDYIFVREYRWQETISDIVHFEDMRKARGQLADLLIDFARDSLTEAFGHDYDTAGFISWLRTEGKTWVAEITEYAYVQAAIHKGPSGLNALADGMAEICARHGLALKAQGRFLEGNELEKALRDFLVDKIAQHVRRRNDGTLVDRKTVETFLIELDDRTSITRNGLDRAMDRIIGQKYRGREEFEKQTIGLLIRIAGLHWNILHLEGDDFNFALTVPGEVVTTNGQLLSTNKVRWQFKEWEAYPLGYVMECRSLVPDPEAQKNLLQNQPLAERETMLQFVALVADREPLRKALQECRKRKSVVPLYDYAKSIGPAKGDDEVQTVSRLLKLLRLPPQPEMRKEEPKGSAAIDSIGQPNVLLRSLGQKLYADK
jgi:hypothetical protein